MMVTLRKTQKTIGKTSYDKPALLDRVLPRSTVNTNNVAT